MAARQFTLMAGDIPVACERKRVKNLNLRVHPDGSVTLSLPWRTSAAYAQGFLNRREGWIRTRVERRGDMAGAPLIPLTGPEAGTLPLWGQLVDAAGALGIDGGPEALPDLGADEVSARIDALYKSEVARELPAVAERAEHRMGVAATRWQVRKMSSRWGSCTPKTAEIRINANLAAYPPACLGFVVAHELTHLMEPSHNKRFHMLLDVWCPGNRQAAAILRRAPRDIAHEGCSATPAAPSAAAPPDPARDEGSPTRP